MWPLPAASASWRITRSSAATRITRAWSQVYKNPDSPIDRYENAWHTDATWREAPPLGSVLRCVECPPVGGDTMWANMVEAYARLPEDVKLKIADLRARHSIEASFGAAMPIEKRLALKAHVSRCRAPGGAHPPGNRGEGAVRQRLHHALRATTTPPSGYVSARTPTRARASCCVT